MAGLVGRLSALATGVALIVALVFVVLSTAACGKKAVQVTPPEPPQLVAEGTNLVIGQLYPVRLTLIERRESDGKQVRTWYFDESADPHVPDAITPPVRPYLMNDLPAGHMRVVQVKEGPLNGNAVPWDQLVIELHPARGMHPQNKVPILKRHEQ